MEEYGIKKAFASIYKENKEPKLIDLYNILEKDSNTKDFADALLIYSTGNNELLSRETNIEYWKLRYPGKSLEELEEFRSKASKAKNKQNLEYWIKKYPEKTLEEVKQLHQEYYQSWLSHQEGWGKGDKNCNSKKNSTQQERNARSPKCIEFYEKKYPELSHEKHLKLLQEQINKTNLNNNYNTSLVL